AAGGRVVSCRGERILDGERGPGAASERWGFDDRFPSSAPVAGEDAQRRFQKGVWNPKITVPDTFSKPSLISVAWRTPHCDGIALPITRSRPSPTSPHWC